MKNKIRKIVLFFEKVESLDKNEMFLVKGGNKVKPPTNSLCTCNVVCS